MDQSHEQQVVAAIDHAVAVAAIEAALPHIVVFESPFGESLSFSGPYDNGVDALVAAEREFALERASPGVRPASFRVAPLYPPLDLSRED